MLIACLSDIHDRVTNLDKSLELITRARADVLICCGDLNSASMLLPMADNFPGEIHVVAGNNDDELEIKRTIDSERLLKVYYHRLIGRLTLDKKRIAFTHKPKDAESLLEEGFDIIFYGHTHVAKIEQIGETWVVNPGDIQGRFGQAPSYALYDTADGVPALQSLEDTETDS